MDKNTYLTTELAGHFVAGQRIPSGRDHDGNRIPKVGHPLQLTEEEARYELLQGTIVAAESNGEKPPLAPPVAGKGGKGGKGDSAGDEPKA